MIDLSFLWPGIDNASKVVKAATNIGWSSLAFNIYFKADSRGVHPLNLNTDIGDNTIDSRIRFTSPSLNENVSPIFTNISKENGLILGINFIRRVTILLLDDFKPNSLTKFIESNEYDIFSVIPTSKRSFQVACESLNCDLINLNYYCYYSPFKLKRGFINSAIKRGCFFEISLTDKMVKNLDLDKVNDSNSKESLNISFQKNLPSVLKYTPLKKLVLSSGSTDLSDLLDPELLIGACTELFNGFSGQNFSIDYCLTKVPKNCIKKGIARRTFGTGIVSFNIQDRLGKTFA